MKYKAILYNAYGGGDTDLAGNFQFYKKSQAVDCVNRWVSSNPNFEAYLWDGVTWTLYN